MTSPERLTVVPDPETGITDRLQALLEEERTVVRTRLASLRADRDAANAAIRALVDADETLGQVLGVFRRRAQLSPQPSREGGDDDAETSGS